MRRFALAAAALAAPLAATPAAHADSEVCEFMQKASMPKLNLCMEIKGSVTGGAFKVYTDGYKNTQPFQLIGRIEFRAWVSSEEKLGHSPVRTINLNDYLGIFTGLKTISICGGERAYGPYAPNADMCQPFTDNTTIWFKAYWYTTTTPGGTLIDSLESSPRGIEVK